MIAAIEQYQYPRLTPEEYLDWEEQQDLRHEYINGEIYAEVYAMTGGTMNHSEIAVNLTTMLKVGLRGRGCRVLNTDAKVSINRINSFLYPDVSVTCSDMDRSAKRFITQPCLIIEVLSPSTEAFDRGDKFKLYRQLTSLQDYVLVDTNKPAIDLYHKTEQGRWEIMSYSAEETVELASVGLSFAIEQIYEGIIFEAESTSKEEQSSHD